MLSYTYIYERWPMLMLFVTGYILFRVVDEVGLPEYFTQRATSWSRGSTSKLLLSIICVCAGLSMFIPNAVTVLAMLPVVRRLDQEYSGLTTALTLSVIYGANIGGMGSLIGSPANILLLGALDLFQVPGRFGITFFSWFIWALPAVCIFLIAAWGTVLLAVPRSMKTLHDFASGPISLSLRRKAGLNVFIVYMFFWSAASIARALWIQYRAIDPLVCTLFFVCFVYMVFIRKRSYPDAGSKLLPILKPKDLVRGIPVRGVKILFLLLLVIIVVKGLGLDKYGVSFFRWAIEKIGANFSSGYTLYLLIACVVIFLTELFSNTLVSTAFFSIVYIGAEHSGLPALPLMILVSICSTCAFMTPIATPCNSLAYGEMRSTSLSRMLLLGGILNLFGACLLSFWMYKVFPYLS